MDQHSRRRRLSQVLGLAVIAMAVLWLPGYLGLPNPFAVLQSLAGEPRIPSSDLCAVVLLALAYVFIPDEMSRLNRYFRLSELRHHRSATAHRGGGQSQVLDRRATGHAAYPQTCTRRADVIFAVGYSDRGGRDLVARERRKVGFKALPDAEDVKRRIEEWIDSELRRAAEEVAEFVESERSTTGSDEAPRARRVENHFSA